MEIFENFGFVFFIIAVIAIIWLIWEKVAHKNTYKVWRKAMITLRLSKEEAERLTLSLDKRLTDLRADFARAKLSATSSSPATAATSKPASAVKNPHAATTVVTYGTPIATTPRAKTSTSKPAPKTKSQASSSTYVDTSASIVTSSYSSSCDSSSASFDCSF